MSQFQLKRKKLPAWRNVKHSSCGSASAATMSAYLTYQSSCSLPSRRRRLRTRYAALTMPSARNECVCTSGSAPAMTPSGRYARASRSNAPRRSRYRHGNSSAQPNSVARCGMSMSAMGFTQRSP